MVPGWRDLRGAQARTALRTCVGARVSYCTACFVYPTKCIESRISRPSCRDVPSVALPSFRMYCRKLGFGCIVVYAVAAPSLSLSHFSFELYGPHCAPYSSPPSPFDIVEFLASVDSKLLPQKGHSHLEEIANVPCEAGHRPQQGTTSGPSRSGEGPTGCPCRTSWTQPSPTFWIDGRVSGEGEKERKTKGGTVVVVVLKCCWGAGRVRDKPENQENHLVRHWW